MESKESDATNHYIMVGARFSKIEIDESAFLESDETEIIINIQIKKPRVSRQKYGEREVIELVVTASGEPEKGEKTAQGLRAGFTFECVTGFVGAEGKKDLDGDLEAFENVRRFFTRSTYWLLRERLQSVASITVLRYATDLPWDLMGVESLRPETRKKKSRSVKKVAAE